MAIAAKRVMKSTRHDAIGSAPAQQETYGAPDALIAP